MWLVSGASAWDRLGGGVGSALCGDILAVGGSVIDEAGSDDLLGLGQAGQGHVASLLDPLRKPRIPSGNLDNLHTKKAELDFLTSMD